MSTNLENNIHQKLNSVLLDIKIQKRLNLDHILKTFIEDINRYSPGKLNGLLLSIFEILVAGKRDH